MAANPRTTRSKTLDEIRGDLSEEMDRLGAGDTTPAIANARVNLIAAHLRTYKLQMDYARLVGKTPNIPLLLAEGPEEHIEA